jgi:hypothetical protein
MLYRLWWLIQSFAANTKILKLKAFVNQIKHLLGVENWVYPIKDIVSGIIFYKSGHTLKSDGTFLIKHILSFRRNSYCNLNP